MVWPLCLTLYTPDLAPCDLFLFPLMKRDMKRKHFPDVREMKKNDRDVVVQLWRRIKRLSNGIKISHVCWCHWRVRWRGLNISFGYPCYVVMRCGWNLSMEISATEMTFLSEFCTGGTWYIWRLLKYKLKLLSYSYRSKIFNAGLSNGRNGDITYYEGGLKSFIPQHEDSSTRK